MGFTINHIHTLTLKNFGIAEGFKSKKPIPKGIAFFSHICLTPKLGGRSEAPQLPTHGRHSQTVIVGESVGFNTDTLKSFETFVNRVYKLYPEILENSFK